MLEGERAYPPEWCQVRDALKAGYKPPIPEPVPPPPKRVDQPGDAILVDTERGMEVRPAPTFGPIGEPELEAVERCLGHALKGVTRGW